MNQESEKIQKIRLSIEEYCKIHLNDAYLNLYRKIVTDLLRLDPEIFNRGKEDVWAAGIVWAGGSINFLGDNSFKPYASLQDVCGYFNVNSSTVGQKASKIREWLDMSPFNRNYQLPDSGIGEFMDSLYITDSGFILPRNPMMEKTVEIDFTAFSEPELISITLTSFSAVKQADIYQLEYIFRKLLSEGEKLESIGQTDKKVVVITYFGSRGIIKKLEKKLEPTSFIIT